MRKIFLQSIAAIAISSSLYAVDKADSIKEAALYNQKAYCHEKLLSCLTHPRAFEHFLEGSSKIRAHHMMLIPHVQALSAAYPLEPRVQLFVEHFFSIAYYRSLLTEPLAAFISLGIGEIDALEEGRALQLQIHMHWLARRINGGASGDMLEAIIEFSKGSSLELFSRLVHPLAVKASSLGMSLDALIDSYIVENDSFSWLNQFEASAEAEEALSAFLVKHGLIDSPIFQKYFSLDAMAQLLSEIGRD